MVKKSIRTHGLPEYRTFHKVPHKEPDNPDYIPGKEWDGGRSLPQVKLHGKWYFVDENLKELRNVKNPHDTKPLY